MTVVTIASFKMKPVYQAAARVEVDKESQNNLQFSDSNACDGFEDSEAYLETQTKSLESETLVVVLRGPYRWRGNIRTLYGFGWRDIQSRIRCSGRATDHRRLPPNHNLISGTIRHGSLS